MARRGPLARTRNAVPVVPPHLRSVPAAPETHSPSGSRREAIVRLIQGEIGSGRWAVGSRIPTEVELSELMSTARSTVREALSTLILLGVLEPRRSVGTVVRAPSVIPTVMADFTVGYTAPELRAALAAINIERARTAARVRNDVDLDRLRALFAHDTWIRGGTSCAAFHANLASIGESRLLHDMHVGLVSRLSDSVEPDGVAPVQRPCSGHKDVYRAILDGAPEAAAAAMAVHESV